jgi:hypothetical protein
MHHRQRVLAQQVTPLRLLRKEANHGKIMGEMEETWGISLEFMMIHCWLMTVGGAISPS